MAYFDDAAMALKIALFLSLLGGSAIAQKAVHVSMAPGINPGWANCTSGTNCLTGFILFETTSGTPVQIASIPQTATTYTMGYPSAGSHTYELVQGGLNGAGEVVQSEGNPGWVLNCTKVTGGRKCVLKKQWQ